MKPYQLREGTVPLLVSVPHCGTQIPEALAARMSEAALRLPDTDWHADRLYGFAGELGASVIRAVYSRYVIDLNRAPDGATLYPGHSNTELCPITCFDHSPIYRQGQAPDGAEIGERLERYWRPYHAKLQAELGRLRREHGVAVLYEAHTIRSRVPRFFEGILPDLNLGTADGRSCEPTLERRLTAVLRAAKGFTCAVNGRFKGGYITRTYGAPGKHVHAAQLELSQRTYMDESHPFAYREDLAARIQPVLREVLEAALGWAHDRE